MIKTIYESEYDYYLGRTIGDVLSGIYGHIVKASGITQIISSIVAGGAVSVGSDGLLTAGGIAVNVAGAAAGTATVTYGGTVLSFSSGSFKDDFGKMQDAAKTEKRATRPNIELKKVKDDAPSWAKNNYYATKGDKNADSFARRILNDWYGEGCWNGTGPRSEFSQIKKWAQTHYVW